MNVDALSALRRPLDRLRGSVVPQLFAIVLAFSCVVTVLLTAVQLHRDYRVGVALVGARLSDIDSSYHASLAEALWRLDRAQLELELDGISRLADIRAVEVREVGASPMVVTAGRRGGTAVLSRDFPIVRPVQGGRRVIGTLHVEATLDNLYRSLKRTAAVILVSQAANTFLVALFITFVLDWLVMRHLTALARKVDRYDFRDAPRPLVLERNEPYVPDELERVVAAFNAMGARLYRAYLDERSAAVEREARHAAEAANSAKSTFIASMSHELRTPLNGILGYAQILRRDGALSASQRENVSVILRCGEHLLALIHDVLDFATIEAGKLRIEIGEVAPAAVIGAIHGAVAVKAADKGLAFACDIAPDVPRCVRADERRLRQVLLNLLTNAVKFTTRGSVALHVTRAASGGARFEVCDTGVGIHSDQIETIFHPFEQAARTRGRDDGIGLGLAISRQFVRAMGADIEVESEIGKGSVFRFELPSATQGHRPDTQDAKRVAIGYEGPRRRVLIVDDVGVNRAVAASLLSDLDFAVITAGSPAQAEAKLEESEISLVVTDIVMPGVDGLEWIRRLRASERHCHLPIIAMSASSLRADIEKSLTAGADAFLPKPLDFDSLLAQIAPLLKLRWIYETRPGPEPFDVERWLVGDRLPTPGTDEMSELHCLARMGDMLAVRRWADAAAAADARHAPFSEALKAMAKAYQSNELLAFVERHLDVGSEP